MLRFRPVMQVLLAVLALVAIDQGIKFWIVAHMDYGEEWPFLPFLSLLHARNTGVAFSMFAGASKIFLVGLPIVILGFIATMLYRSRVEEKLARIGFVMIMGGAIGNVIDRAWLGYVVDYVYFHTPWWSFAIFNFADTMISLGAGMVILQELVTWRQNR